MAKLLKVVDDVESQKKQDMREEVDSIMMVLINVLIEKEYLI